MSIKGIRYEGPTSGSFLCSRISNFFSFSASAQSISKFDERCCFLYVHDNSDDFQIYFSTEEQCAR